MAPDGTPYLYFVSKNDGTHYFSRTRRRARGRGRRGTSAGASRTFKDRGPSGLMRRCRVRPQLAAELRAPLKGCYDGPPAILRRSRAAVDDVQLRPSWPIRVEQCLRPSAHSVVPDCTRPSPPTASDSTSSPRTSTAADLEGRGPPELKEYAGAQLERARSRTTSTSCARTPRSRAAPSSASTT